MVIRGNPVTDHGYSVKEVLKSPAYPLLFIGLNPSTFLGPYAKVILPAQNQDGTGNGNPNFFRPLADIARDVEIKWSHVDPVFLTTMLSSSRNRLYPDSREKLIKYIKKVKEILGI